VQAVSGGGGVRVVDVPAPTIGPTEVLVRTDATIVSAGTERAITELAGAGLLAKARARPDLVRKVADKARAEGVGAAARSVRARLGSDLPLGYSGCGRAVAVGDAVAGIRPGDLVATGGAGRANHADFQAVPGLLCARVPDGVSADDAAFATIASIALHGLRLAEVGPGAKVVVIGLGLVGQLAARLALASGCDVAGIDLAELPLAAAASVGVLALKESGTATTARIRSWSRGRGADAVLICAAGRDGNPVARATELARDRAQLVVVGDVPLNLARAPFYERELSLRFARSYGPGRYERGYEDWGVDYPAGQVRWTEGRNQEAVLDLLAGGRLTVADLVTHTFEVDDAPAAYQLVATRAEPYLAIRFRYPPTDGAPAADDLAAGPGLLGRDTRLAAPGKHRRAAAPAGRPDGVGWIGAGAFSASVLLPAFRAAGFSRFTTVASAGGRTAGAFADRHGFAGVAANAWDVIDDDRTGVVVIASAHDSHAGLTIAALERGRHVWCEKPPALTLAELDQVERAAATGGGVLMIGYNRRFSPAVLGGARALARRDGPLTVVYRVAAGPVPPEHWYADRRQGGRLLGEVCHFVDTCAVLAGSPVEAVTALAGRGTEALLASDVAVALRHADGTLSTIAYSSARPADARKEAIEAVTSGDHLRVDDFRRLVVNGRVSWRGPQDKGHQAAVEHFRSLCQRADGPTRPGEPTGPDGWFGLTAELLASSRATLAAAVALGLGGPADLAAAGEDLGPSPNVPAPRPALEQVPPSVAEAGR